MRRTCWREDGTRMVTPSTASWTGAGRQINRRAPALLMAARESEQAAAAARGKAAARERTFVSNVNRTTATQCKGPIRSRMGPLHWAVAAGLRGGPRPYGITAS